MTLRLRILRILLLSCLLGDAIFIALFQPWHLQQTLERETAVVHDHLVTLGDGITPFLLQNQLGAIHETLEATLARQPEWRNLELRDPSGALVYPLEAADASEGPNLRRLSHEITLRGATIGRLDMSLDLTATTAAQRRQGWIVIAFMTSAFLCAAVVIAALLQLVVGRPAVALARAAGSLADGDFSAPLPTTKTEEIDRVSAAFDAMRAAIAAQQTSLRQALKDAEAASDAKSTFLAVMSHELRTPMNGILGMAELLQMPELSDAERQEYASIVHSSGSNLLDLLNSILDVSRIESGRQELEHSPFEVASLLAEVGALFEAPAQRKGLQLESAVTARTGTAYVGDSTRLRQMLSNLINNAIKFTDQGFVRIEIDELARTHETATLEFAVVDSGPA